MRFNLHTHTARCHHADGSDREYIEAAIASNIKILGFADHCPQFFPTEKYYSFFRMKPAECEDYVSSVMSLREEYKSDIKILLGFETEYYPQTFEAFSRFISEYPIDYLIMGEHFIGNEYDKDEFYAGKTDEELLRIFVDQVTEGLRTGAFTYLAHPDNFFYKGDKEVYRELMTELCKNARELDIPLEYNMLGKSLDRHYPNPEFWKIAAATGNRAVIGYDAHQPEMLTRTALFKECKKELDDYGIKTAEFEKLKINQK